MGAPDGRAVKTLLDAYWSSEGWRSGRDVPEADLDHAVRAGVMVGEPSSLSHDEVISAVLTALRAVPIQEAVDCFLASLSSRRLDLRSALGSCLLARRLEPHAFVKGSGHVALGACAVCGLHEQEFEIDWDVMNFERFKWGGVRRDDLTYVLLDLRQFGAADRLVPTDADRAALAELLDGLEGAPPATTAAKAASGRWAAIPSNKAEREVLLDILGVCSVLESPDHHGFLESWIPEVDRVLPPLRFVERSYPVCWWRAEHGVNRSAARSLGLL